MKKLQFTFITLLLAQLFYAQHSYPPQKPLWDADTLGNQRAVIKVAKVAKDAKFVKVVIPWRNRKVTHNQKVIIVDSLTNSKIQSVRYLTINKIKGAFLFHPTSGAGIYYVYYLPYKLTGWKNYPTAVYLKRDITVAVKKEGTKNIKTAKLLRLEAVDTFNQNSKMERLASKNELTQFLKATGNLSYYVFPENRKNPIIMDNYLPKKWVEKQSVNEVFRGKTNKGVFYAFQFGIWANKLDLNDVKIKITNLKSKNGTEISSTNFTCINTEGVDYTGKKMRKTVNIPKSKIQALWSGINIPKSIASGIYTGLVTISTENLTSKKVHVSIEVTDEIAKNGDVAKPWLMTRLPWLNSTMAQKNTIIKPYTPLKVNNKKISLLGRKVILDKTGFPKQIQTFFTSRMTSISKKPNNLLRKPIQFDVKENGKNIHFKNEAIVFTKKTANTIIWQTSQTSKNIKIAVKATMEFDGFINYTVKVTALHKVVLDDIALQIPFFKDKARYFMGLGRKGGYMPQHFDWKWDVAHKNQDGGWLGNVNGGLQFSLRDEHYSRPLNTNFYLKKPLVLPTSWGNGINGGITIHTIKNESVVNNYSGKRTMKKGDVLYYNFHLLITPFHTINTSEQWNLRFFHAYKPLDYVKTTGATVINIHHATDINPYINYPFVATKQMKNYISEAHKLGLKVKIYNTIREVSNRMYELFPVRSLGSEVFSEGKGGGYSWLQEHLGKNYISAWFVPKFKDAAIINSGMNRWHNYYVEGMNWLVDNIGIDGIYLDDVAFDRVTMKRIKRVLTKNGHPGIIDLHSANQYNKRDGFNNSANLYMEHFPYLNRLWFGEYFDYENNSPDFFLTEVSGIPFGLMGEMLQGGGNPWRGMVYGMTNRLPWSKNNDPRPLWKAWDNFGIKKSEMIGYWADDTPVITSRKDILATVYKRKNAVMVSIGSWAKNDEIIKLNINWKKLGMSPNRVTIEAPKIKGFQDAKTFKVGQAIPVKKNKGWLLIIYTPKK